MGDLGLSYNANGDVFTANQLLFSLLKKAKDDEKLQLTRVIEGDRKEPFKFHTAYEADKLCYEITIAGGNSLANTFRNQGNSYWDILDDVAKNVLKKEKFTRYSSIEQFDKVPYFNAKVKERAKLLCLNDQNLDFSMHEYPDIEKTIYLNELENKPDLLKKYMPFASQQYRKEFNQHCLKLEEQIFLKLLDLKYSSMNEEEKNKFDQAVREIAVEKGLTSGTMSKGVAGLILIGEMGGFTTYMLMSMFISKIGLGVLGFGVFTGASTLLGIILGPIGWIASGSWILWDAASPNKNKMAQIVVIIALIRLRLQEEEKATLARNEQFKKEKLESEQRIKKAIRHIFKYPRESSNLSYQNLKHRKNKKGRKKY